MKKPLLIIICATFSFCVSNAQSAATEFNVNDCGGTNHDLFVDLDAGKVVVIAFVMPCAACIGPSLSAYTEVQNYETSHSGRMKFFLADDAANTSCTTLTSWANTNGMDHIPVFSDAAVIQSDYGIGGMPKIVVLGGTTHSVLYAANGPMDLTAFDNAIDAGLATGIEENSKADLQINLFPNPAVNNIITLDYCLPQSSDVKFDIYNTLGSIVKGNVVVEKQMAGKHEISINVESLSNGIYFIKLNITGAFQVVRFTVFH